MNQNCPFQSSVSVETSLKIRQLALNLLNWMRIHYPISAEGDKNKNPPISFKLA